MARIVPALLLVCLVGCLGTGANGKPRVEVQALSDAASAEDLWQRGQDAIQAGNADQAIYLYQQSLRQDATRTENHLSLAAAFLARGEEGSACDHLGKFLQTHTGHASARFYYAELLVKLGRHAEATVHYEKTLAHGQLEEPCDLPHLVHCHGRLLEIGEILEDDYLACLHRGIGMFLLARQKEKTPASDDDLSIEALLFKSAGELKLASTIRPREARPSWYLAEVWRRLGQHHLAEQNRHEATTNAPFTYLSPQEQNELQLAKSVGMTRK